MKPENLIGNSSEVDALIYFVDQQSSLAELDRWLYDPTTRAEFRAYKKAAGNRVGPLRKLLTRALKRFYSWQPANKKTH